MSTVGRLQQAREDAGYSREQVARVMDVSERYVGWVETARVELRPEIAERLAALYKCSPEWLKGEPSLLHPSLDLTFGLSPQREAGDFEAGS